jgi:tRNA pseudouridine55 synthase
MLVPRPTSYRFAFNLYRKFSPKNLELQGQARIYGIFYWATTPSYDLETEVDQTYPTDHINEALIHETVKQFLRNRSKPIFSAIKKDGVRLYEHARAGETVEIAFRKRPFMNLKLPELSCLKLTLGSL